jgi:DNA-binding NarL/FixJ family response regulator
MEGSMEPKGDVRKPETPPAASAEVTVFLADDHAMVREGLAAILAKNSGLRIVGQCGDGLKVTEQVRALEPDVVVLDISLPGLNGLDICRHLSRKANGTAILILTMHNDDQFVATALKYRASGYLLKESASDQLVKAILAVARGEVYLGPGISKSVLQNIHRNGIEPYEWLTTRERQVLQMIAEGKTNKLIAEELCVAVKTVDTHRARMMRKLDIHDQTSLVKFALRKGIVTLH